MARKLQFKLLILTAIISLTLSEITQSAPVDWKHLEEPTVGLSLSYAPDWFVDGQVIATQLALHARCSSVRIIDSEQPPESGSAAWIEQSYVQICVQMLKQNDSLDQYMRRVFGKLPNQAFVITDLNGTRTYQMKGQEGQGHAKTISAEIQSNLIQIVVFVTTSPKKFTERQAQVETILRSLTLV